jgi:hypothetical protein
VEQSPEVEEEDFGTPAKTWQHEAAKESCSGPTTRGKLVRVNVVFGLP